MPYRAAAPMRRPSNSLSSTPSFTTSITQRGIALSELTYVLESTTNNLTANYLLLINPVLTASTNMLTPELALRSTVYSMESMAALGIIRGCLRELDG